MFVCVPVLVTKKYKNTGTAFRPKDRIYSAMHTVVRQLKTPLGRSLPPVGFLASRSTASTVSVRARRIQTTATQTDRVRVLALAPFRGGCFVLTSIACIVGHNHSFAVLHWLEEGG